MERVEVSKEKMLDLMEWCLDSAIIEDNSQQKRVDEAHKIATNEDNFNQVLTDMLYLDYEKIYATSDEYIIGVQDGVETILYHAPDSKLWIDANAVSLGNMGSIKF